MLQSNLQHPPAHSVAEAYHPCCKPFAYLSYGLHKAARDSVFAGYDMDRGFIAKVSELKGSIESAVESSGPDLLWTGFWQRLCAIGPAYYKLDDMGLKAYSLHSID